MKSVQSIACCWFSGCVIPMLAFWGAPLLGQDDALIAKIKATREFILKKMTEADYRDSIRKSVLRYEESLSTHCKSADLDFASDLMNIRILWPLEMNDQGVPVAGRWRQRVPGTACNEKRLYNVQVDATKDGWRFTPTFPGGANGDPELQQDTLKNIEMDLKMLPGSKKSCHGEVLDTRIVGPSSEIQKNGLMSEWSESWELRSCGKLFTVPVRFIPDGKGTAISVGVSEIQVH